MINQLSHLISVHPHLLLGAVMGLQYIWSALVDSLPQPRPMSSQIYQFFFTFSHKLAGNLSRNTSTDANQSMNKEGKI